MPRRCLICDHPQREEIDKLLVDNRHALREIAQCSGVSIAAIHRHRHKHLNPRVTQAAVRQESAEGDELLGIAIASKRLRLEAMQFRWEGLLSIIDERAVAHAGMAPGGSTRLLMVKRRFIRGEMIEEYTIDAALLRELRELEKLAAQMQHEFGSHGSRLANNLQINVAIGGNDVAPEIPVARIVSRAGQENLLPSADPRERS
jgi:hypothetical protein